jgi:hypothetical protein
MMMDHYSLRMIYRVHQYIHLMDYQVVGILHMDYLVADIPHMDYRVVQSISQCFHSTLMHDLTILYLVGRVDLITLYPVRVVM